MGVLSLNVKHNIATITIDSPPANALSSQLLSALNDNLNGIGHDSDVKAVIIKGEGKFFRQVQILRNLLPYKSKENIKSLLKKVKKFLIDWKVSQYLLLLLFMVQPKVEDLNLLWHVICEL